MIANKSPLKLQRFVLFELGYAFSVPIDQEEELNWFDIIDSYPIDIDFDHLENKDELVEVRIKITVNAEKEFSGFTLSGQGVGVFSMETDDDIEESLANNLRIFSSLNICINSLRNEFASCTSQSPIGGYYLPAIDIASLIDEKKKEVS